jgi:hypothetical protein
MTSLETGINPSPLAFPCIVFTASAEDLPQPSAPHNDQAVKETSVAKATLFLIQTPYRGHDISHKTDLTAQPAVCGQNPDDRSAQVGH